MPDGTTDAHLEQAVLAEQAGWDGAFVWEARDPLMAGRLPRHSRPHP
jgi:hypothetical protein